MCGTPSCEVHTSESSVGYAYARTVPPSLGRRRTSCSGPRMLLAGEASEAAGVLWRSAWPHATSTSADARRSVVRTRCKLEWEGGRRKQGRETRDWGLGNDFARQGCLVTSRAESRVPSPDSERRIQ